ncbi:MAG TPA: hypothetical protein VGB16_04265, partial [candidate division Zixibacteria bacterium]
INLPSPSPRFGPPRRAIGETGEAGLFSKEGKKEVSPFEKGGFDGSIWASTESFDGEPLKTVEPLSRMSSPSLRA